MPKQGTIPYELDLKVTCMICIHSNQNKWESKMLIGLIEQASLPMQITNCYCTCGSILILETWLTTHCVGRMLTRDADHQTWTPEVTLELIWTQPT